MLPPFLSLSESAMQNVNLTLSKREDARRAILFAEPRQLSELSQRAGQAAIDAFRAESANDCMNLDKNR